MRVPVDAVFVGDLRPLPPEGQLSGIFKTAVLGRVRLTPAGLEGDRQGDPRYHGGPEKALHHYPAEHYARLSAHWPELEGRLAPGVLGENLSTRGMNEHSVCIGDVYRLGDCLIQVSQPRQPCWKISHRLDVSRASVFVADEGITGWYYRVLEGGELQAGDELMLLERPNPWLPLAEYWQSVTAHRPEPATLRRIAVAVGLAADKAARCAERADWLARRG